MGTSFSPAAQKALWSLQLGLQSLVGIMGKLKPHQQPSDCSAKGSRTWVPYSSPINSLWAALLKAAKPRKHHLMTHLNTPLPPCSFSKDPLLRRLWSDQSLTPLYQFCFSFTLMIFFKLGGALILYNIFRDPSWSVQMVTNIWWFTWRPWIFFLLYILVISLIFWNYNVSM